MGYFDGETFVFRRRAYGEDAGADSDEEDAWVDGGMTDQKGGDGEASAGTERARAGEAYVFKRNRGEKDNNGKPSSSSSDLPPSALTKSEIYRRLCHLLNGDDETVLGALGRYGNALRQAKKRRRGGRRGHKGRNGSGKGGGEMPTEAEEEKEKAGEATSKDDSGVNRAQAAAEGAVSQLTELADVLLMGGDGEAYDRNGSDLKALLAREEGGDGGAAATGKKRKSIFDNGDPGAATTAGGIVKKSASNPLWVYRGNVDREVHGPYSTEQMMGWVRAGYFVGEAAVDVRRVRVGDGGAGAGATVAVIAGGGKKGEEAVEDLMADLMDSDDDDGGDGGEGESASLGRGGKKNGPEDNDGAEEAEGSGGDKKGEGKERVDDTVSDGEGGWRRSDRIDFLSYL